MKQTVRLITVLATLLMGAAAPASATLFYFNPDLTGDLVKPLPVVTDSTGTALLVYDDVAKTLDVHAELSGILTTDLFAKIEGSPFHLHVAPPDFIGSAAILLGQVGDWAPILDAGNPIGASLDLSLNVVAKLGEQGTGTFTLEQFEAALLNESTSQTYMALHTLTHNGGELRGNLGPVPEPATLLLLGGGLLGLATLRRRA